MQYLVKYILFGALYSDNISNLYQDETLTYIKVTYVLKIYFIV